MLFSWVLCLGPHLITVQRTVFSVEARMGSGLPPKFSQVVGRIYLLVVVKSLFSFWLSPRGLLWFLAI